MYKFVVTFKAEFNKMSKKRKIIKSMKLEI